MEDFVTFEIAKKLKEKGFPQHITEDAYIIDNDEEDKYQIGDRLPIPLIPDYMNDIAAPTISQVLKWFRKKYSIHISTKPYSCEDGLMWLYEIRKFNKNIVFVMANKTGFVEEEQASIAGIEYVLDNLIG